MTENSPQLMYAVFYGGLTLITALVVIGMVNVVRVLMETSHV